MKAGRAFTLVELIVVMVIVAIMAAVAVPAFSNSGSSRAAVAARMISRDLAYARERAIATGTRTWVVFSPGTQSYSVLAEDPTNPGRANASPLNDPLNNGKRYIEYLNSGELVGITLTGATFDSGTEIGFDWVGKPYNSGSTLLSAAGTVTLSAGGYTVTVQPATGLAKVTP
jgi:prepilin-type N-terminal cleavage/methylation domain-containing protein